jgi:hypothetical protein
MKLSDIHLKSSGMRTSADTRRKLRIIAAIQNETYEQVLNKMLTHKLSVLETDSTQSEVNDGEVL